MAPIEITTELVFNQPPTSGRFLIPDSGQAACSQLTKGHGLRRGNPVERSHNALYIYIYIDI